MFILGLRQDILPEQGILLLAEISCRARYLGRTARYLGRQDILLSRQDPVQHRPRPRGDRLPAGIDLLHCFWASWSSDRIHIKCSLNLKFNFRFTFWSLKCSKIKSSSWISSLVERGGSLVWQPINQQGLTTFAVQRSFSKMLLSALRSSEAH